MRSSPPSSCVAIAYSGGRDSTALLHVTLVTARHLGVAVVALHVNHRLSMYADAWERHCRHQCKRWAADGLPISFAAARLRSQPQPGDSIEAWARRERYAALKRMAPAHGAELLLLAHHRRDQAETLILQALRSAGVAGLSGMPRSALRDGLHWARPWLDTPRRAIEAYVQSQGLAYIDDDSNTDERYARNRLRHRVWPALEQAFPDAEPALAAAATWAQQATACLDEVAVDDLSKISGDDGLTLSGLQALSIARRVNALRAWLHRQTGATPPATLITRLNDELFGDGAASWPLASGLLRRYRGHLTWRSAAIVSGEAKVLESTLSIRRVGTYRLPGWGGRLQVARVKEGGVPLAWLAQLALRERSGGERFQAGIGRPARSLKKQFQAAELPAWQRSGPLLYSGGQLVFVPGLGIDARVIGLPGQPQVTMRWEPSESA